MLQDQRLLRRNLTLSAGTACNEAETRGVDSKYKDYFLQKVGFLTESDHYVYSSMDRACGTMEFVEIRKLIN